MKQLKRGLVFGKFMPLHKGHLALIEFAAAHCDELTVLLCTTETEPIPAQLRLQWLEKTFGGASNINVLAFAYDEKELPNTSVSSREVSKQWAGVLQTIAPATDLIISSEPYGAFVAAYTGWDYLLFDEARVQVPVSATMIRQSPLQYWDAIAPAARPYFVKKIFLLGSESTGKSTLTALLARHFSTAFVPEVARDIVAETETCTFEDLEKIAAAHAVAIETGISQAHKLLFIDTDISITQSYARFLFHRELPVTPDQLASNKGDLYFFLETDCPFVQDGTRLQADEREKLSASHKSVLQEKQIKYLPIRGNWEERLQAMIAAVNQTFFIA